MNLVDSTTPVAPSSRAATPVSLDLSKTKITNFEANAFAFNSDTPISILTLPTSVAIADNGIANNAFSFQSGSTIEIKGGKDVTAAQMQQFAGMLTTGTNLSVSANSVNWKPVATGQQSEFEQFVANTQNIKVEVNELNFTGNTISSSNLEKYSLISNLQLPSTFTTFNSGAFVNTTIGSITFGTSDSSVGLDSGTQESTQLAAIINLFSPDSSNVSSEADKTTLLASGWDKKDTTSTDPNATRTKTLNSLEWLFDPTTSTIKCSQVNGFVFDNSGTKTFESFKEPLSVTIFVSSEIKTKIIAQF